MPITGVGAGNGNGGGYVDPWEGFYTGMGDLTADVDLRADPTLLPGWSAHNIANLASLTQNPSGNGRLRGVLSAADYRYWSGTWTNPRFFKTIRSPRLNGLVFARLRADNVTTSTVETFGLYVAIPFSSNNHDHHHNIQIGSSTPTYYGVRAAWGDAGQTNVNAWGSSDSAIVAGVWVGLEFSPNGVTYLYDATDSATPPHERGAWQAFSRAPLWNLIDPSATTTDPGFSEVEVGFIFDSYGSTTANATCEVMHFDDSALYRDRDDITDAVPGFGEGS